MPHATLLSIRFNPSKLATSCCADALSRLHRGHPASRTLQIIQSLVTDADTPPHMQHTQEQKGMPRRMWMEQDRRTTPSLCVPCPFVTCWPSTILHRAHAPNYSSTVHSTGAVASKFRSRLSRVMRVDSVIHQLAQFVVMAVTMSVMPDGMATKWTQ